MPEGLVRFVSGPLADSSVDCDTERRVRGNGSGLKQVQASLCGQSSPGTCLHASVVSFA